MRLLDSHSRKREKNKSIAGTSGNELVCVKTVAASCAGAQENNEHDNIHKPGSTVRACTCLQAYGKIGFAGVRLLGTRAERDCEKEMRAETPGPLVWLGLASNTTGLPVVSTSLPPCSSASLHTTY